MRISFLIGVFCFIASIASAQVDSTLPPFKRYPTLPPLQLLLQDSTTKYTKESLPKKKAVVLMLFSPDCEHCQHEAEQIAANKELLKDVQIVMVTGSPIYRIQEFGQRYGLSSMPNVVIAKDPQFFLFSFYGIRYLPFMALYDKKGNLVTAKDGAMKPQDIVALLDSVK